MIYLAEIDRRMMRALATPRSKRLSPFPSSLRTPPLAQRKPTPLTAAV